MSPPEGRSARSVFVNANATGWLAARRYGMPARMVAGATARREAGDWRGACAAARFDVHIDLADVADRHGNEIAARLTDDLRRLAPDLVRWHLPRHAAGGSGLLLPRWRVALAWYCDSLALYVRNPVADERPQVPQLHVGDPRTRQPLEDWAGSRYLWDAHATHLLLPRFGGDRAPFFARDGRPYRADAASDDPVALLERVIDLQDEGRIGQAWEIAGVTSDLQPSDEYARRSPEAAFPEAFSAMVPVLVPVVRQMLERPSGPPMVMVRGTNDWGGQRVLLSLGAPGQLIATHRHWSTADVENVPAWTGRCGSDRPTWSCYAPDGSAATRSTRWFGPRCSRTSRTRLPPARAGSGRVGGPGALRQTVAPGRLARRAAVHP
ncbi:hypothetical protein ACFQX7_40405 [Luedemannella flava]